MASLYITSTNQQLPPPPSAVRYPYWFFEKGVVTFLDKEGTQWYVKVEHKHYCIPCLVFTDSDEAILDHIGRKHSALDQGTD